MGKNSSPPPNYQGAAAQQEQSSQQNTQAQTAANRANQTNAFGASSQWSYNPNTGQWTQSAGFGGPLGQALSGLEGQAAGSAGQPFMTGDQARQQAVQGIYGSERQQLDPQWQQAAEQNQAQLANEGLDPTSAAARAQNNQFSQAQNQAYGQALGQAEQQGTAAGQAVFEQNMAARNAPFQQLAMLQGLGGQSGYNAAGVADPLQALQAAGLQGQQQLAQQQLQNQQMGEYGQALGGIVSALPFMM